MYILKLFEIINFESVLVRKKTYPGDKSGACSQAVSELGKWEKECKGTNRNYKIVFDYENEDHEIINIGIIKVQGGTK